MAESVKPGRDKSRADAARTTLATLTEAVGVSRTTVSNAYNPARTG